MTISIEHVMPSELEVEDRSMMGQYRPGNIVTRFDTGNFRSRSFFEHNLQDYNLRFSLSKYTDDDWELMMALLDKTAMNALPFWIKEPISKAHGKAIGEITVSGETTYVFPLDTATDTVVQVGPSIDFASKTIHAAANLMTDAQANGDGGVTTGLTAYGSCAISSVRFPALAGRSSILIDPTGTVTNVGITTGSGSGRIPISDTQDYTVGASFLVGNAAHQFTVAWIFYDGATPTGSGAHLGSTGTVGEWLHMRSTITPAANDDSVEVRAYRTSSSADNFHIGCFMCAPGDFERWFMPSMAPRLVEWDTAPTAGERLLFSAADCQRWTRVVLARNRQGATVELKGDTKQDLMRATEVVYRKGQ